MLRNRWIFWRGMALCGVGLHLGCASKQLKLPEGHYPPPTEARTAPPSASSPIQTVSATLEQAPPVVDPKKDVFQVPPTLPGANVPPIATPKFDKNATPAEREKAVREAYPVLAPLALPVPPKGATPLSLAELETMAIANSPAIKRASADAAAAHGQVIQAGLHPNPTTGYQSDQVQPGLKIPEGATFSGAGQQGGFINQLIKTAGKLSLAQKVAGFDYINALVAVRGQQVTVIAQVRAAYYSAIVAQQNLAINKALADMIDEVYGLQLKRVAAGVDAGYEPLQIYAQAVQVRNAFAQAEATYRASWKQIAAAVGQPDLPQAPLSGRADAAVPVLDEDSAKARILEQHTDLLIARNNLAQGHTNLILQKRLPIPDISTNQYHQYDNAAQAYQFGLQFGIALPIFDRNQGNIRSAQARIVSYSHSIEAVRNDLFARFAEAHGRYKASTIAAVNYRDKVLPSLTQAYASIVRRYQVEPEKVGFSDIVVAQQNLAAAMQAYQSILDAQWKSVVDLANITQVDELEPAK
jgi:cobalt-zinc-cadmium efflux system outer membrane protein